MMTNETRVGRLAAVAASALLAAACAGMGKTPEQAVAERAQERLDLVLAEDYAGAYRYLSPGYRSSLSEANYQRRMLSRKARWTGAVVGESTCSEDVCKVRISIDYTIYGAVPGVSRFDSKATTVENWVKVDGNWYFVPET